LGKGTPGRGATKKNKKSPLGVKKGGGQISTKKRVTGTWGYRVPGVGSIDGFRGKKEFGWGGEGANPEEANLEE